ncbi:hypothetical protein BGX31_007680 [Mortierella sp. GBA43]|nr:hypothetical protein BGX31_007680 [Mortierella sp. GBA43]
MCDNVDGESVIFWDDICHVFPKASHVKMDNIVVNMMRDSSRQRIQPWCIKHYPGVILDVVLPISEENGPVKATSPSPSSSLTDASNSFVNVASRDRSPSEQSAGIAVASTPESETDEQLPILPGLQAHIRSSLDLYRSIAHAIWNGKTEKSGQLNKSFLECLEGLKASTTQLTKLQKSLEDTHIQDLEKLALLRPQIQTILACNYELYENPAPRLFAVLPQDIRQWNFKDPLSNKLRLYFMCDCGEHTRSIRSTTPHHIHFTKHEGYEITCPKEFFQEYGSYVLTIMKMVKFGISMAGVTVPPVSQLVSMDVISQDAESEQLTPSNIEEGMDQIIGCIEKTAMDERTDSTAQWTTSEALEPAYLQGLDAFLRRTDENEMGNLYKTVNADGSVRWVCIDHFRELHHEKEAEAFCALVKSLEGSFDETIGHVEVRLQSTEQADQLFQGLEKAVSVHKLRINLDWCPTFGDFKKLKDALAKTNVAVLAVDLNHQEALDTNSSEGGQRYDPLMDIMGLPTLQSFTIIQPPEVFSQRAGIAGSKYDFSNLRILDIDVRHFDGSMSHLRNLLSGATKLSSLTLSHTGDNILEFFNAIAEYQTYSIHFPSWQLSILPPTNEGGQSMEDITEKALLFKIHGGRVEGVKLYKDDMVESTLKPFAKSTKHGSNLKVLILERVDKSLAAPQTKSLTSIISRSKLHTLDIGFEGDGVTGIQVLESIQWSHMRTLGIRMDREIQGMAAMEALHKGIKEMTGSIPLQDFVFYSTSERTVTDEQVELVQRFVEPIKLRTLDLNFSMTLDQTLSVLKSMGVSKLQRLYLWAMDFVSTEDVDAILGALERATELRSVTLRYGHVTQDHIQQMEAKGITLTAPLE